MFLREEPPPERDDSHPSSSGPLQTFDEQHAEASAVQPSQTDIIETVPASLLSKQHETAQAMSHHLLDTLLDISKDVAAQSNAEQREQLLALLRSCINTYHAAQGLMKDGHAVS